MLTAQLQQLFSGNRLTEKPCLHFSQFQIALTEKQFSTLLTNIIRYCEQLKITRSTTFLAKVYLDIVLSKSNSLSAFEVNKVALCCIWTAVKFNQSAKMSNEFSPQILCEHSNNSFSPQDIIELELYIFSLLDFRLKYTTPYDVMQAFMKTFPWLKAIKIVVLEMLLFVITLPEINCDRSENIFYSAFLASCDVREVKLSELQRSIVYSQIVQKDRVQELRRKIVNAYQLYDTDETHAVDEDGNDMNNQAE